MKKNRKIGFDLIATDSKTPIIFKNKYNGKDKEKIQIDSAIDFGGVLIDGVGDGIFIDNKTTSTKFIIKTAFSVLQATRTRISATDYISCPSCGRTQFELQKVTAKIKSRTNHLKGIKIAIMGCIVNGPGEMADADYGYVGTGKGLITLYKQKEIVERNIPSEIAVDSLISVIKKNNDWVDVA